MVFAAAAVQAQAEVAPSHGELVPSARLKLDAAHAAFPQDPNRRWAFDTRPPVALRLLKSSAFHAPLRAADLLSTEIALQRHGLEEQNPLGKTRGMRVVLVVAASAGTTWLDHKLENKKAARWALRIGHGLLTAWVVQNNVAHTRGRPLR